LDDDAGLSSTPFIRSGKKLKGGPAIEIYHRMGPETASANIFTDLKSIKFFFFFYNDRF
jgi:hypothetical protein